MKRNIQYSTYRFDCLKKGAEISDNCVKQWFGFYITTHTDLQFALKLITLLKLVFMITMPS